MAGPISLHGLDFKTIVRGMLKTRPAVAVAPKRKRQSRKRVAERRES